MISSIFALAPAGSSQRSFVLCLIELYYLRQ
jgi:hypothetical protein